MDEVPGRGRVGVRNGRAGGGARGAAAGRGGRARGEPQPEITDATITADIKTKLENNKLLRNERISVVSTNGVVTLIGTVPSELARDEAVEAARSTPGVVRVDDDGLRLDISSPNAPTRY